MTKEIIIILLCTMGLASYSHECKYGPFGPPTSQAPRTYDFDFEENRAKRPHSNEYFIINRLDKFTYEAETNNGELILLYNAPIYNDIEY